MNENPPAPSPEPVDPRDERLVTIATFPEHASANIARSVLESEGISACLGAETASTMLSYYGMAIGGVKLLVLADQAEKAKALLDAHSAQDFEEPDATNEEALDDAKTFHHDDEEEESPAQRERDARIRRAWAAAIVGVFLCPPALNLYSMYSLLRHGLLIDDPQFKPNWRSTAALILNLVTIASVVGFVWLQMQFYRSNVRPMDY